MSDDPTAPPPEGNGHRAAQPPPAPPQTPRYDSPPPGPRYDAPPPGPRYGAPAPGTDRPTAPGPTAPGPAGPGPVPWGDPRPTMAARPGIVPLRPLTLGDIYAGAFGAIRTAPATMIGISFVVYAVPVFLIAALGLLLSPTPLPVEDIVLGTDAASTARSIVVGIVSLLLGGFLVLPVRAAVVGRRMGPGEAWRRFAPRILPVLGAGLLSALLVLVVVAVLVGIGVAIFYPVLSGNAPDSGVFVGGVLGLIAYLLVAVAVVLLVSILLVFVPVAVVVEPLGPWQAIKRSFGLVRGGYWRTLGIVLLTNLLVSVVVGVLLTPVSFAVVLLLAGAGGGATATLAAGLVAILWVVVYAVVQPFSAAVTCLLYLDRRMRKEGHALELIEEAERTALRRDAPPAAS